MRTGIRGGKLEGQRGFGLAWRILRKLLDTRGVGISCLRSRVERRSNCSSETTGEPAGSAGAQGLHWGLAHSRRTLSPGPGLRFSSPEAGTLSAFGPLHSHPRSLSILRPRPSGMLSRLLPNPREGPAPSLRSWCGREFQVATHANIEAEPPRWCPITGFSPPFPGSSITLRSRPLRHRI